VRAPPLRCPSPPRQVGGPRRGKPLAPNPPRAAAPPRRGRTVRRGSPAARPRAFPSPCGGRSRPGSPDASGPRSAREGPGPGRAATPRRTPPSPGSRTAPGPPASQREGTPHPWADDSIPLQLTCSKAGARGRGVWEGKRDNQGEGGAVHPGSNAWETAGTKVSRFNLTARQIPNSGRCAGRARVPTMEPDEAFPFLVEVVP
jgi:hypothetical protein